MDHHAGRSQARGTNWLPEDADDDPVPAILEYLPYRKRDGTVERDHLTHPYFAGHGYAGVRVTCAAPATARVSASVNI